MAQYSKSLHSFRGQHPQHLTRAYEIQQTRTAGVKTGVATRHGRLSLLCTAVPVFVKMKAVVRRVRRTRAVFEGSTPSNSAALMTGKGSGLAGPSSMQTHPLNRWANLGHIKTDPRKGQGKATQTAQIAHRREKHAQRHRAGRAHRHVIIVAYKAWGALLRLPTKKSEPYPTRSSEYTNTPYMGVGVSRWLRLLLRKMAPHG